MSNASNPKSERFPYVSALPEWDTVCIAVEDDAFPKNNESINTFVNSAKFNDVFFVRRNDTAIYLRVIVWNRSSFDSSVYDCGVNAIKDWMMNTNNYQIVYKSFAENEIAILDIQHQLKVLQHNKFNIYFNFNHKCHYVA